MAKRDFENRSKSVSDYLIQSQKVQINSDQIYALFSVTYSNKSTQPNTLPRIELSIKYRDKTGELSETFVSIKDKSPIEIAHIDFSSPPINLSAKSSKNLWFLFELNERIRKKDIYQYRLIATTDEGCEIVTTTHLLFDTIINEKS